MTRDDVFITSTPEWRGPNGQREGIWRCADREALQSILSDFGSGYYAEHHSTTKKGVKRLLCGHRRNDQPDYADKMAQLYNHLKRLGFRVRWMGKGAFAHVVVSDHAPIKQA